MQKSEFRDLFKVRKMSQIRAWQPVESTELHRKNHAHVVIFHTYFSEQKHLKYARFLRWIAV